MASLSQVDAHRQTVSAVTTLAMRDLVAAWRTFTLDDAVEASRQVQAILPLLVDGYGTGLASLSADWYEELREAAKAAGRFTAAPAATPPVAQQAAVARWAVGPLFGADPDHAKALSLLAGGVQRLIVGMDRDTIATNADRDPGRPVWARHASANACAFCAMLATRDAVYGSKDAAGRVVGRGTSVETNVGRTRGRKALGIRARGARGLGEKYHDHCHCVAVPVWPGQQIERAPYVDAWEKAYTDATRGQSRVDTKATLAEMRQSLGTN